MHLACNGSCVMPTGMYLITSIVGALSCGSLTVKHLEPNAPYYVISPMRITLQELCLWIDESGLGRLALNKAHSYWSEPFHIGTCITSNALDMDYTILASNITGDTHLAPIIIAISLSLLFAGMLAVVHAYLLLGSQRK